jgi:hypothetical protein
MFSSSALMRVLKLRPAQLLLPVCAVSGNPQATFLYNLLITNATVKEDIFSAHFHGQLTHFHTHYPAHHTSPSLHRSTYSAPALKLRRAQFPLRICAVPGNPQATFLYNLLITNATLKKDIFSAHFHTQHTYLHRHSSAHHTFPSLHRATHPRSNCAERNFRYAYAQFRATHRQLSAVIY